MPPLELAFDSLDDVGLSALLEEVLRNTDVPSWAGVVSLGRVSRLCHSLRAVLLASRESPESRGPR